MTHFERWQFSVRYNPLRDGLPSKQRWRFFHSARDANEFISSLNAIDGPQVVGITVSRREIGEWGVIDRLEVEAMAVEERAR
jgi:hypothetical protein